MSPGPYRHYRDAEEECEKWSKTCLEEKLAEKSLHLCKEMHIQNQETKRIPKKSTEKDTLQSSYKKAKTEFFYWSIVDLQYVVISDAQYSDSIFL